jgi:hypothetical protein
MAVKVTRYGGPMAAMKPKTRVFQMEDLDASTKRALGTLLENSASLSVSERIPDGFVYSFEIDEAGAPNKEVEVNGTHVPDALRKLLP